MSQKIITHIEALEKAKSYCAYQERCHQEVETKLIGWKLNADEIDYVMMQLMEENFLNEERFACAYAGGKFRIKKWGRKKIIQNLKAKKISEYCIKKGLEEIIEEDYYSTLVEVAERKYNALKDKNLFAKKNKTAKYLYGRGFETELIWEVLNDLSED